MNKKFISALLAGAMVVSLAGMNAFAADEAVTQGSDKSYGKDYTVPAGVEPVTLQVVVPDNLTVVLNPYGLETGLYTEDNVVSAKLKSSVASPAYKIKNRGETNVSVSITGSVAAANENNKNLKFLTALPTKDSATKDVFLYVKMGKDIAAASADADKTDLILGTKEVTKANYYIMAKQGGSETVAYMKINGFVNGKADSQWTDDDGVKILLKFKFEATGKAATDATA